MQLSSLKDDNTPNRYIKTLGWCASHHVVTPPPLLRTQNELSCVGSTGKRRLRRSEETRKMVNFRFFGWCINFVRLHCS